MVHVPYKSAGLSVTALIANETQLQFVSPSSSLHYIKAGRMRVLDLAKQFIVADQHR